MQAAGQRVLDARQAEHPELVEAASAMDQYMAAYTRASLRLTGRWPAFVPTEERTQSALDEAAEDGTVSPLYVRGAEMADLGSLKPGSASSDRSKSTKSSRPHLGPSPHVMRPHGAPPPSDIGSCSVKEEELRETVAKLHEKLRVEVTERSRAAEQATKRGLQLGTLGEDYKQLQESHRRQGAQLQAARDLTLKLESELRESRGLERSAEKRAVAERKRATIASLRLEKAQKTLHMMHRSVTVIITSPPLHTSRSHAGGEDLRATQAEVGAVHRDPPAH